MPDATLTLLGDDPLLQSLKLAVGRDEVGGVIFAGAAENEKAYYRAANVVLLSSLGEGLPYTLLEAAGTRLPIIASDVGGVREILQDEINGMLIPPGDIGALKTAMLRPASDSELRVRMGRANRVIVERDFRFDEHISGLLKIYERIVCRAEATQTSSLWVSRTS